MGRFAEAAAVGEEALAAGADDVEDFFRQAQILLRAGEPVRGAERALGALSRAPDPRYLAPLVEAILLCPELEERAHAVVEAVAPPRPLAQPVPAGGAIHVPMRLPYYAPLAGDHPFVMGLVRLCPDLDFRIADPRPAPLCRFRDTLALAKRRFSELRQVHPAVTAESAAAYVASRFEAALYDAPGCRIDLLSMAVTGLGERPFVLVFDYLPVLFQPFFPYEDTRVGPDHPFYWIVRHTLEAPECRAIIVTYRSSTEMLAGFFDSPAIRDKCVFVNPCFSLDETTASPSNPSIRPKEPGDDLVLLFTASRNTADETFYARGGVDVLAAFAVLAEEEPRLRLLLRTPLPRTLGPRLRALVHEHPRIEHYPEPLPWDRYRGLFERADLFLLPGVTAYRNGLVQAMGWGVVPVLSDGAHMAELVEDGETGVIVPGRARRSGLEPGGKCFVQDWTALLQATDGPADPAFFEAFVDALRTLIRSPERLASLQRTNLAADHAYRMSSADLERFAQVLRHALR